MKGEQSALVVYLTSQNGEITVIIIGYMIDLVGYCEIQSMQEGYSGREEGGLIDESLFTSGINDCISNSPPQHNYATGVDDGEDADDADDGGALNEGADIGAVFAVFIREREITEGRKGYWRGINNVHISFLCSIIFDEITLIFVYINLIYRRSNYIEQHYPCTSIWMKK